MLLVIGPIVIGGRIFRCTLRSWTIAEDVILPHKWVQEGSQRGGGRIFRCTPRSWTIAEDVILPHKWVQEGSQHCGAGLFVFLELN
jgi:hypothetical protein